MPDPAKSIGDIDDVLSSIRRLVAEQPRTNRTEANHDAGTAPAAGREERLVLTPALRVTEPDGLPRIRATEPQDAAPVPQTDPAARLPAESRDDVAEDSREATGAETHVGHAVESAADPADLLAADPVSNTPASHDSDRTEATLSEPDRPDGDGATAVSDTSFDPDLDAVGEDANAPAAMWDDTVEDAEGALASSGDALPSDDMALTTIAEDAGTDADMHMPEAAPDAPDAPADAFRAVGEEGWRPEMRLFDWSAASRPGEAAPGAPDVSAEFEPDTGDANWPDETADRAVLDLAAVRETVAMPEAEDAEPVGAPETTSGPAAFTPIFSRRSAAPAAPQAPAARESLTDASRDALPDALAEPAPETTDESAAPERDHADATFAPEATPSDTADAAKVTDPVQAAPEAATHAEADHHGTGGTDDDPWAEFEAFAAVTEPDWMAAVSEAPDGARTTMETAPMTEAGSETDAGTDRPDDAADTASPEDNAGDALPPFSAETARLRVHAGGDGDSVTAGAASVPGAADSKVVDLRAIDTSVLEEEVLRRIVAEAVRAELQGALGERITRNVRKLVRREIRLVLAADELD